MLWGAGLTDILKPAAKRKREDRKAFSPKPQANANPETLKTQAPEGPCDDIGLHGLVDQVLDLVQEASPKRKAGFRALGFRAWGSGLGLVVYRSCTRPSALGPLGLKASYNEKKRS